MLEGERGEHVFYHLVARHAVQHHLKIGACLERGVFERRRAGAELFETTLEPIALALGLSHMLAHTLLEIGIVLKAVRLCRGQADSLTFHGMGIAQPGDQELAYRFGRLDRHEDLPCWRCCVLTPTGHGDVGSRPWADRAQYSSALLL
ncbi:MAG TPA: hypothetical protein VKV32_12090 [Stellaceae bacterium]|nr:hypothetical protein [Stellaceae bacterium]